MATSFREVTLAVRDANGEVAPETFYIGQLPTMRACKLMFRLIKLLGAPLLEAIATKSDNKAGMALGIAAAVIERATPEDFESLTNELLAETKCGTADVMKVFNVRFKGQLLSVLDLWKEALEENYGDFTGALAARFGVLQTVKNSGELKTSSGPSTV